MNAINTNYNMSCKKQAFICLLTEKWKKKLWVLEGEDEKSKTPLPKIVVAVRGDGTAEHHSDPLHNFEKQWSLIRNICDVDWTNTFPIS